MKKLIAVFGAGEGLGRAVAQRFGREGYKVALIARNNSRLENLASALASEGIEVSTFQSDLSKPGNALNAVTAVLKECGDIDVVYYAPSTTNAFIPATEVTTREMRSIVELSIFSLFDIVGSVLPGMLHRGQGAILSAVGGDLSIGMPYMSGFAIGHSAARNYLYSLHGEVCNHGVNIGLVSISGIITGSDYYKEFEAGHTDAPEGLDMPLIDPSDLARALWDAANGKMPVEAAFPIDTGGASHSQTP